MKPKRPIHRFRGFTLVELLVVIAIIVVLAGLAFTGVAAAKRQAKKADARNVCTQLDQAIISFYDDYSFLPSGSATPPTQDTILVTNASEGVNLVHTLIGYDNGSTSSQNSKGLKYLNLHEIRDANFSKSGIEMASGNIPGNLTDPWKEGFRISMDYDYDGKVENPLRPGPDYRLSRRNATCSYGENKTPNNGSGDDVASF